MSFRRLDLGFQPRPRLTRAALGMLLVGAMCASVVVGHYQVTLGRLARAKAESLASHRERGFRNVENGEIKKSGIKQVVNQT